MSLCREINLVLFIQKQTIRNLKTFKNTLNGEISDNENSVRTFKTFFIHVNRSDANSFSKTPGKLIE